MSAPFAVYVRVSEVGDREGPSFGSPEEQEAGGRDCAESYDVEPYFTEDECLDLDVSGALSADERKLGRLIERIEAGEFAGLIVRYIDRFGRDMIENALAHDRIIAAGGRLIAWGSGYDSANLTPDTRMVFNIQSAIAQAQREKNKLARIHGSRRAALKNGVYLSSVAPFGYLRREQVEPEYNKDGTLRRDGVLVVDTVRGPLVELIFKKRADDHWTIRAIRDWLRDEHGIERTLSGVTSIIKNRAYLGEARVPTEVKGRSEIVKNAHPALITEDLWERANAVGDRARFQSTGRLSAQVRLSGLAYCAGCGRKLKTGGNGGVARYTCTHEGCPSRAVIKASDLDEFVQNVIATAVLVGEPHVVAALAGDDRYKRALQAVEDARTELEFYRSNVQVSKIGVEAFERDVEARKAALDVARKELRSTPAPTKANTLPDVGAIPTGKPHEFQAGLARKSNARFVARVVVRSIGRGRRVPAAERAEIYLIGAEEPLDVAALFNKPLLFG